jgi:hypothetical protein
MDILLRRIRIGQFDKAVAWQHTCLGHASFSA